MAVRPVVLYPDPVLLQPTAPVATVDQAVRELVADLVTTMHHAPGIGLAANQIGVSRRVCVVDLSVGEDPAALHVLINPVVRATEGRQVDEEGCLSFPDITLEIERPERATVEALGLDGRPRVLETEGLLARAILHECEHLDGQTFLRNVSALRRELVKKRIRKRIKAGDWVEATAE
jgi:peptide deformylase